MPKLFLECIKKKGEIKTESLSKNRYQRICILDGKTYAGEIQTRKSPKKPKKR